MPTCRLKLRFFSFSNIMYKSNHDRLFYNLNVLLPRILKENMKVGKRLTKIL